MKRVLLFFRQETGQSLVPLVVVALLNFAAQIVFRRDLQPGEFGTLNTALGVVGLMTVPVLAVGQAFVWYIALDHPPERLEKIGVIRSAAFIVTETVAWASAAISLVLIFLLLPLLDLPRFSLNLFTMLNVFVALGGIVSGTICQSRGQIKLWASLLIVSALARVLIGVGLAGPEPWAESGLAAVLLAGFVLVLPALRQTGMADPAQRLKIFQSIIDRDFLVYLGATFSVLLAIFLFTSADRIIAQSWFGTIISEKTPVHTIKLGKISTDEFTVVSSIVDWFKFDAYQAAGLLGRALLWGTQPLLLIFFARRSRLNKTTPASLTWFWIYLGTFAVGAILLGVLREPISWFFCEKNFQWTAEATANFIPIFALAVAPMGLLQGLGIFALASRRYPECFLLGGCGVAYTLFLYLVGRKAELMVAYMFGGGVVSLMIVLFVGVVRWGRKQP